MDSIVCISQNSVDVYPNEVDKPPHGQKLNKPAIITLWNVKPKAEETIQNLKARLKEYWRAKEIEYKGYDPEIFEWGFKVDGF